MKKNCTAAIVLIALFNFIFLGTEYMFDNMMAYVTDSKGVVLAQNYVLGISVVGFLLFPVVSRLTNESTQRIITLVSTISSVVCIFVIQQHESYGTIMGFGLLLFILLGMTGSQVHFIASRVIGNSRHLAKMMGIAYAMGILFQFINNNCVKSDMVQSIVLSVSLMCCFFLTTKLNEDITFQKEECTMENTGKIGKLILKNPIVAGSALAISVVLMTCIFSTLDSAVTLVHATGSVDIGQWPRLLLALSGLIAGVLYDLKGRRYMNIMMYCVTLLSTICVVILQMGGPFLAGLVVFYLSAGFFVVFFTVGFMDLSYYMKVPELWAGFGRATNNICAVITGNMSVILLSRENGMAIIITALVLFALISVSTFVYSNQFVNEKFETDIKNITDDDKMFEAFSEAFLLTDREQEVLKILLISDENVQDIAGELAISRAALYRHIGNLNEKTNTKSRIGLIQFYYGWKSI